MAQIKLFLLSVLFIGTAHAAVPPGAEGFIEIDPYAPDSPEFQCANMSREEWAVSVDKNMLSITPAKRRTEAILETGGGRFTGKDGGEFEGDLRFSKGKDSQILFKENISALFQVSNDTVIAFGGLAHLSMDYGYMLMIKKLPKAFGWKLEKKVKLPANPSAVAVAIGPDIFYFMTGDGLYSIDWKTEQIEKLKATYVTRLYPNSIAVGNDKHIYIGMRYAVVHLIPAANGYDVKWLVKARCKAK